ncbi:MAG: HAMP domain-containing protein [Spirochaetes bacterium]|nr:HAMP domain-containing protein [Spirochaetota bacterium]
MGTERIFYLNSFSIGSLIAVTFFVVVALFLLSLRQKSKATLHLGLAFAFLAVFNFGYLICASIYHPLAAFHRWITVACILIAEIHGNLFYLCYPEVTYPRFTKWYGRIAYGLMSLCIIFFCVMTVRAERVFLYHGHYWDFNADEISKYIGIVIVANIVITIIVAIWKVIVLKGRERWIVALLGGVYLVSNIIPSLLNTMSRDGVVGRDIFNNVWVLLNLTGYFFMTIVYLNNSRDRFSFIGKIIGISLVAFLIVLQFSSYISLQERDEAYDEIYHREMDMTLQTGRLTRAARYRFVYTVDKDEVTAHDGVDPDGFPSIGVDLTNAYYYGMLKTYFRDKDFTGAKRFLEQGHPYFGGYRGGLKALLESKPENAADPVKLLDDAIGSLNKTTFYHGSKIRQMPDDGFRGVMEAYLAKEHKGFGPFADAMKRHLAESGSTGRDLKAEMLRYLAPVQKPGSRVYRTASGSGAHYVSFCRADYKGGLVHEVGFSYEEYRGFMHKSVLKLVLLLGVVLVVVRFGFQLFFRGVLITPLRNLSHGVRSVNGGDLETSVPVIMEDEIGYVTRSFNTMVATIRGMIGTISTNSFEIKTVSKDMDQASQHLADIARELTAIVEEAASAYEEMSSSFEKNLDSIRVQMDNSEGVKNEITQINAKSGQLSQRVSSLTDSINEAIRQVDVGAETIDKSIRAISGLAEYLKRIEETVNSINELADKINLLALNAAIEAARAGEQGRGFAVVADEVNKLADQTTELVKGIQSTIVQHTSQVAGELQYISGTADIFMNVRSKILETGDVMKDAIAFTTGLNGMNTEIQTKIEQLSGISGDIYTFSHEQVDVLQELTKMINTITDIAQNTLQNADVVRSFSKIIEQISNELNDNIEAIRKRESPDEQ